MLTTTFENIKASEDFDDFGWPSYMRLAHRLGTIKKYGRTTPITVEQVLDALGMTDAFWVLDNLCGRSGWIMARRIKHAFLVHYLPEYLKAAPSEWAAPTALRHAGDWLAGQAVDSRIMTTAHLEAMWAYTLATRQDTRAFAFMAARICTREFRERGFNTWKLLPYYERPWQEDAFRRILKGEQAE